MYKRRTFGVGRMATMMLMLMMLTLVTSTQGESICRTNFGYSLESLEPQVRFSTENGRIVVSYTLPQLITVEKTPQQENEENEAFSNPCAGESANTHFDSLYKPRCRYILNIVEKNFALRRQALYLVHHRQREINALIADITDSPRQKRGLGSFISSGLAWTFDLATGPDVEQLRSLLRQMLTTTNKALSAWTVGQNLITRVTKLTSNRFDQIDRLINPTRLSLIDENRQMQDLKIEGYTAQRLLSVVRNNYAFTRNGKLIFGIKGSRKRAIEPSYYRNRDLARPFEHFGRHS